MTQHLQLPSTVRALGAVALAAASLVLPSHARQSATTTRVSVGVGGLQCDGPAQLGVLAEDGSVLFHSSAPNLGAPVGGGAFRRDGANTTTTMLSVDGSSSAFPVTLFAHDQSRDGRFVVLTSNAATIVAGDTNGVDDVFLLDSTTGLFERVSVSSTGVQGDAASAATIGGSVSETGRFVVFESRASNFVAGDVPGSDDVFVRDTQTGLTECISVLPSGLPAGLSLEPTISADGNFVVFTSRANSLVAGDLNNGNNLFVRDRAAGTTRLVDVTLAGSPANGLFDNPSISGDGRFVLFASSNSQLVPGDTNSTRDVFVADMTDGSIERVSVSSSGAQSNGSSLADTGALISHNGRFVAFSSRANNLTLGDSNGVQDVFLRDRWLGTTQMVSLTSVGGPTNGDSWADSVSDDGRTIAFTGYGTNLVPNDTNGVSDEFVRSLGAGAPQAFCTAGTTANGCNASITANVNPNTSATNGCVLQVTGVEGGRVGLIFYGVDNAAFTPAPWNGGTSFRCVRSPVLRTGTQMSGGTFGACDGVLALDWDAYQLAQPTALGAPWVAGSSACAQAWFRDPPSPGGTSLSNAVVLQIHP